MTFILSVVLISISIIFFVTVLWQIRQERLHIANAMYWLALSVVFLLISMFPKIVNSICDILGITGTQNLVFLVVIGAVLLKVFNLALRLSVMEDKIKTITQAIAIEKFLEDVDKSEEDENKSEI